METRQRQGNVGESRKSPNKHQNSLDNPEQPDHVQSSFLTGWLRPQMKWNNEKYFGADIYIFLYKYKKCQSSLRAVCADVRDPRYHKLNDMKKKLRNAFEASKTSPAAAVLPSATQNYKSGAQQHLRQTATLTFSGWQICSRARAQLFHR